MFMNQSSTPIVVMSAVRGLPIGLAIGLAAALLVGCGDATGTGVPASASASRSDQSTVSFPASVEVATLDPAVRDLLAGRLAAVAATPEDPIVQAALADAWLAHDRADLAVDPARFAARAAVGSEGTARWILLGDALAATGDVDGALAAGREALAIGPDESAANWRMAGWALDAGDLDLARRHAVKAVSAAPDDPTAARMLATVLLADGTPEAAIDALSPFAADPRDGATHYLLARAYAATGRDSEAERSTVLAGGARPEFVDPWLQAVRETRVDLAAQLNLALDAASQGRREEAMAIIASLRPLHPGRRELDSGLMGVHALLQEHDEVLAIADRLIADDPNWTIPRTRAGFAAFTLARRTAPPEPAMLARASVEAEALVRLAPDTAEGHELLGRVRAADGRWDEALVAFQRALDLDPSIGRRHLAVGECLVMTGSPLDAVRVLNDMDRIFGRSVDSALVRVRAMASTGRVVDARALLEQCRRAMPQHPGVIIAEQAVVEAGG
jgi:predicted Zn-dependent protease